MMYRVAWMDTNGVKYHSVSFGDLTGAVEQEQAMLSWPWVSQHWIERADWVKL